MNDLALAAMWFGILALGLGAVFPVRAMGMPTTHVRDFLHLGAGIWVLGWSWWSTAWVPVLVCLSVFVAVSLVPFAARRVRLVARFRDCVAQGNERFAGLIVYTGSYAVFTFVGMTTDAFPAAAGLLSLSIGDGLGGAVGLRFGRHRFRTPFGKEKSFEGSVTVALGAALGILTAATLFDVELALGTVLALGCVAAVAEGIAPRSSDNALIPIAVWAAAEVMT
jgi:dolichol kinase